MENDIYICLVDGFQVNVSKLAGIEMIRKQHFGRSWKSVLKRFKSFLIWNRYEYSYIDNNGDILFLRTPYVFQRSDYMEMCQKVSTTYDKFDYAEIKDIKPFLNIKKSLFYLIKMFSWRKQLKQERICCKDRIIYYYHLIQMYNCYQFLQHIDLSKYKLGLVFYDNWIPDNAFVQCLQHRGIKTATLQHGQFIASRDVNRWEYWGAHFSNSMSDYFLAWNKYTRQEALKEGMSNDKIKLVGMPKYIDYDWVLDSKEDINVFGVMLCKSPDEDNRKMIFIAEEIANQLGMRYYIKYHPSYCGDEYAAIVTEKNCIGVIDKRTSIQKYCALVDFTLIANSSAYVELLFLKQKVYRMNTGLEDLYFGIEVGVFNDTRDLLRMINNDVTVASKDEKWLYDFLCTIEKPYQKYAKFFKDIGLYGN